MLFFKKIITLIFRQNFGNSCSQSQNFAERATKIKSHFLLSKKKDSNGNGEKIFRK